MEIRSFSSDDATAVRELFIRVTRLLAPADLGEAFEIYIARSLAEEIDSSEYYSERKGGFWVAVEGLKIVGIRERLSRFIKMRDISESAKRLQESSATRLWVVEFVATTSQRLFDWRGPLSNHESASE